MRGTDKVFVEEKEKKKNFLSSFFSKIYGNRIVSFR